MNRTAGDRIGRHRSVFRVSMILLGAPLVATGSWAVAAPHDWYRNFPGGGRHWISALGPYNEHITRDFASLLLGIGLLLVVAALVLRRQLVQAALGTTLVWAVPHFVFHMVHTDELSTGDNVVNLISLALTVAVPVVLLALTLRPEPEARQRTSTAPAEEPVGAQSLT